ncbi:MAG: NitT/TauT family transport system ATP-binding protein [Bradyrhizobium sp.]|jgi:NitT/TauT family transport system ATP-binding protein|nr:NitT/TauT family transport system ATP-binding protein [Bradyrhizobium sp.]
MDKIVVDSVYKSFSSQRRGGEAIVALDNVSLTIAAQEIVCIVGPSGCGKSTLLNLIAGFDTPTSGEIEVSGMPVTGAGPDRIVVFQSPSLFPWMTVMQNVTFGPRKRGVPRAEYEGEALSTIEAVGLSRFAQRFPYELSGGMRQRVQIARALVNRPQVLLMDEPFAALDFQNRLVMQELLLRLWDRIHPTIFFITHDVEEAIFLGDRVYVMTAAPGRIKAVIDVPFPKPRLIETVTAPKFVEIKEQVLHLIRSEFEQSERAAENAQSAAGA